MVYEILTKMFGLFKRTKIYDWELSTLSSILSKLPDEYSQYRVQVENGVLKGVMIDVSDIHNYVGFSYNPWKYKEFYDSKGRNFRLSNIKVMDILSGRLVNISLYFSYGLINGYSVDDRSGSKFKLNSREINVESFDKKYIDNVDFETIKSLLNKEEIKLLNQNDVYTSLLKGKKYFHLKELEDGDFIGIDLENNLYRVTHDPFEFIKLKRNELTSYLNGHSSGGEAL